MAARNLPRRRALFASLGAPGEEPRAMKRALLAASFGAAALAAFAPFPAQAAAQWGEAQITLVERFGALSLGSGAGVGRHVGAQVLSGQHLSPSQHGFARHDSPLFGQGGGGGEETTLSSDCQ